jgi:hypothetical protein
MLQFEPRKMQEELRMKQLKREILHVRKATEQLRHENVKLKTLLCPVDQLGFPPESSSTPQPPTEPDYRPSSP